jgi:hypothetical protein
MIATTTAEHSAEKTVKLTINGKEYHLPEGKIPVAVLKKVAGIPAADEVAELKDGKVIPLPDDGFADAERCEVFTSYPRSCPFS